MSISRRQFVRTGASAALAGGVVPLLNPAPAQAAVMSRMKLETFSLTASNVSRLRSAVAAMKALPANDHRSWFWQSAVHSVLPSWISALPGGTAPPAAQQTKFWNQCPHTSTHGSAEFLIWHRAYLYYFERTLRAAASDPTLSLPYWNYEDAAQRKLPAIYRTPTTGNSLYISQRLAALNAGTGMLSSGAVSASAAMGNLTFFGTTSANFGGYIAIGTEPSNKGLIEQSPHDTVHGGIGGSTGWMSSVPTAAFDPIFWPHHAEIDHLFTLWDCVSSFRGWGPPSSYDAWWDQPVGWFMDANGAAVHPTRRAFAKNAALSVTYDDDTPNCVPLTPATSLIRWNILDDFRTERSLALGTATGGSLSAERAVSSTVAIDAAKLRARGPKAFAPNAPERLILGLGGIEYGTPPSVAYEVYVSVPGQSRAPRRYRAGILTFFNHPRGMEDASAPHLFDISAVAREQGFNAEKLEVTFVPFDLVVDAAGQPAAKRLSDVRIATIEVRQVTARL